MLNTLLRIVVFLGFVTVGAASLYAQEDADLILHPGDTVTWSPNSPHRLRFGGKVVRSGAELELTAFSDIQKILVFDTPLTADSDGIALGGTGTKVVATVKDDAANSGVGEFFFTCGFSPHNGIMATVPFKIEASGGEPARDVQIVSGNPPKWILKTAQGDKSLNRP